MDDKPLTADELAKDAENAGQDADPPPLKEAEKGGRADVSAEQGSPDVAIEPLPVVFPPD